jgi:predicted Holliday junction resolvase-like endonuclease
VVTWAWLVSLVSLALVAAGSWLLASGLAARRANAEAVQRVALARAEAEARADRVIQERTAIADRDARAREAAWVAEQRAQVVLDAEAAAAVRFAKWKDEYEAAIRKDAVTKSTAVIRGNVSEQLLPFMDAFPYDPRDCRFLGSPIDLIVFDGLYGDGLREIVFLEVKTGESSMNKRERDVRDAVRGKMVRWEQVRK